MTDQMMTCPLCSTAFDPAIRAGCSACPIGKDCSMVCCPTCGHTTIDPRQSRVASWFSRWALPGDHGSAISLEILGTQRPLTRVDPGVRARVVSLSKLPQTRQRYLHAFGVVPGADITVRQQRPVTIIEVDRTELAIEDELAELIQTAPYDVED